MKDGFIEGFINKRMLFFCAVMCVLCVYVSYYVSFAVSLLLAFAGITVMLFYADKKIVAGILGVFLLFMVTNARFMLSEYEAYEGKSYEGIFTVKVISYPERTTGRVKCRVRLCDESIGEFADKSDDIFLYVYSDDEIDIIYGGVYEISGKITAPSPVTVPGAYDYKGYLLSEDVKYTVSVNEKDITYIMTETLPFGYDKILDMRRNFEGSLTKYMSETSAGLIGGIMFGSTQTDSEVLGDFRALGVAHVLAVSGLHVGIIYGAVFALYSLMKIKSRKGRIIFCVLSDVFILFYIALSGFSVSCIRAAFLIAVSSSAALSEKYSARYDTLSALSLIGMINMAVNPYCVFGVSFILSYSCVIGIIFISPVITSRVRKIIPYKGKFAEYLVQTIIVSLSVTVFIAPLSVKYFGTTSMMGFLYNLIMVPAVSVCLILGITAFVLRFLSFPLLYLCGIILENVIYAARLLADSNLMIYSQSVSAAFIAVYYIILFAVAGYIALKGRAKIVLSLLVAVIIAAGSIKYIPPKYSSVSFLDVGFGDCALIRTKDNKCILIDGGGGFYGGDTANDVIIPYLRSQGIRKLDVVIATHSDSDHIDGITGLIGNFPVDSVIANEDGGRLYYVLKQACEENGILLSDAYAGDVIKTDDCEINVLSPGLGEKYTSLNDRSIVLSADVGGVKYLFTGDASKNAEKTVLENSGAFSMEYDILKAPHHGSDFATDEFRLRMFCDVCVISVGNNGYGLPDKSFEEGMKSVGAEIFRTDKDGTLKISSTGNGEYFIENYMGKWRKIYDTQR